MKFLHTSDWHLGHKLIGQARDAEHALALDWLMQTIEDEQIEALILAGDIFDANHPPASAENLYYNFLARLIRTNCRHIVIVGGNHDLPSRLNAPARLLKALNVHVIGSATDDLSEEIVVLEEKDGTIAAVVAAIPFLRDKDFKISISGETTNDRHQRIKDGIAAHYKALADLIREKFPQRQSPPLIATGHLFATGASATPEQNNIYIGNLENINADQFPDIFDYIALGHIHRPQKIGKKNHIRYSGSLIPLNFSEISDKKLVLIGELMPEKGLTSLREVFVPTFRRLLSIRGKQLDVEEKIMKAHDPAAALPAWLEVIVESDGPIPNLDIAIREKAKGLNLELLKIKNERPFQTLQDLTEAADLDSLTVEEVFLKKCQNLPEIEQNELLDTFRELVQVLEENA